MKLKRIRKVEYDEKGEAIIEVMEHHLYDVHFIDNEDWLCIDEEDYTEAKKAARKEERLKELMKQYAEVDYTAMQKPYSTIYDYNLVDVSVSMKITQTVDKMITIDSL